jgi:hypothetical protein
MVSGVGLKRAEYTWSISFCPFQKVKRYISKMGFKVGKTLPGIPTKRTHCLLDEKDAKSRGP